MAVTLYLFDPQLVCLATIPDPVELIHKEAAYQVTAEFKTPFRPTTGYSIGFMCLDGRFRIFEIDQIDFRDDTGDCYCVCTDRAVRELTDIVITDIHCDGMTVVTAAQKLIDDTVAGWQLGNTVTTEGKTTRHYYCTFWASMNKLMEAYNVKITPWFDFDTTTATISARVLDIDSVAPEFCGRLIESGDGANNVIVTISGNPKTALYGRGKGEEVGETASGDTTYGRRITFKDVVWSVADGDPVNKPAGQEWVGDDTAKAMFGRNGKHRFGIVIFEDETDPEQLLQRTWDYLQTAAYPILTATATVYDLELIKGYSYAAIRVGHEVILRPQQYTADFRSTILEIERNYIHPENTRVTISTGMLESAAGIIRSMESQVIFTQQQQANALTRDSVIDTMVTKIMSSGTNMYTDPDNGGAWIFENSAGTTAMMITGAGWMIADSKTGGHWNWRTAATGEGMVADEITTGTLYASLIQIFGSDHFYWDAENIYIREAIFKDLYISNMCYQVGTERTETRIVPITGPTDWIKQPNDPIRVIAEGFKAGNYTISWSSFQWSGAPSQYSFYLVRECHGTVYQTQIYPEQQQFSMDLIFRYDSTAAQPNKIYVQVWIGGYAIYFTNLYFRRTETDFITDWSTPVQLHELLRCSSGYTEAAASLPEGKYRLTYDAVGETLSDLLYDEPFELGTIRTQDGANADSTTRARQVGRLAVADVRRIAPDQSSGATIQYAVRSYKADGTYKTSSGWLSEPAYVEDIYGVSDAAYIRIVLSYVGSSAAITDVDALASRLMIYKSERVDIESEDNYQLVSQNTFGTETVIDKIGNRNLQIDFKLYSASALYVLGTINLNEIRIGKFDGEHYGIGYTTDGGATWQTAIDFNGLAFSGEAVSLRTENGLVDIRNGYFNVYAGSQVSFQTDAFSVKNEAGRSLISISSEENREGQVILGEDGFPVGFGGGFILPVVNGGTGYSSGQTHRVRAIPSASFGEDGDLAVFYAGANTSYSAFSMSVTSAADFPSSNIWVAGYQRRWNNQNGINNAIPAGYWAVGNDAGYPYGVYGYLTPPVEITGGLSLEITIGKYVGSKTYGKANGTTLMALLCSQDGNTVLAETTFAPPDREMQTITITFNTSTALTSGSTYMIAICDMSDQVTWSYALIEMGSLTIPGYSGSSTFGLYVKSGGQWHEIGGAS